MQKIKMISPAIFLIAVICFFLPFININCADEKIMTLTGFQMMKGVTYERPAEAFEGLFGGLGLEEPKPKAKKQERSDPEPLAIICFVLAILGLALSFLKGSKAPIVPTIIGSVGSILLLMLKSKIENDITRETGHALKVEYLYGYWLTLICFIVAAVVNILIWFQKRNDTVGETNIE